MPGSIRKVPVRPFGHSGMSSVETVTDCDKVVDLSAGDLLEHSEDNESEAEDNDVRLKVRRSRSPVEDGDDEDEDEDEAENQNGAGARGGGNVLDLFTVRAAASTAASAGGEPGPTAVAGSSSTRKHKRGKWKLFKDDVRRYSTAVKQKLTIKKKDKNGVKEISIKPDLTINGQDIGECWTVETMASSANGVKRVKSSASLSDRTGSANSSKSNNACAVTDMLEDDDGIETIYDAEYQGAL